MGIPNIEKFAVSNSPRQLCTFFSCMAFSTHQAPSALCLICISTCKVIFLHVHLNTILFNRTQQFKTRLLCWSSLQWSEICCGPLAEYQKNDCHVQGPGLIHVMKSLRSPCTFPMSGIPTVWYLKLNSLVYAGPIWIRTVANGRNGLHPSTSHH